MKMYAPVLKKLADEYHTQIGFAAKDGLWLDVIPWQDVGQKWRPRITVLADFWAGLFLDGVYSETYDWASLFDQILQFSDELIVLGGVPVLPVCLKGGNCGGAMAKNELYNRGIADGSFVFLTQLVEHCAYAPKRLMLEAAIEATGRLPRFAGRVKFVEVASYFQTARKFQAWDPCGQTLAEQPYLQVVDPITGGLVYTDPNHLGKEGAQRIEQVFRKELFGQPIC